MSKTYLVGGYCRDTLLGLTPKDKDYVVVGSSREEMLNKGFMPVGADFEVFLHPITKDEYALARVERKEGVGYKGFTCEYRGVSLEEDLGRRDLSINSIAIQVDESTLEIIGDWIDPYSGIQDIKDKWFKHTTEAFAHDPLRVLRVARFMARYGSEWTIDVETLQMMYDLAATGELSLLTPERVWLETQKALTESTPSLFFDVLKDYNVFTMTKTLENTQERNEHHPEINCWLHTAMVMDYAATAYNDSEITWACYTHDFGKPFCYNMYGNGHGHEVEGLHFIEEVCDKFKVPNKYRELALLVCKHHQKIHSCMSRGTNSWMRPKTIYKLLQETNAMSKPERFSKILKACVADSKGRGHTQEQINSFLNKPYPQQQYLEDCLQAVKSVDTKSISGKILAEGKKDGLFIGEAIRVARIAAIKSVQYDWKNKEKLL